MAYPNKPSSAPAIPLNSVGRSTNLNDIFSAIAVEKLLALKTDGTYDNNFSIGDNTLNSLVNEINIRQGSTIKEYDNTGANLLRTLTLGSATNLAQGFRFLDESIKISNNATNPSTEIDVSAGNMVFDDGTGEVRLSTNLTKSTANDFENGGLLPNGTVLQTNTWYYVFVIYSTDSNLVNFFADTSPTPNLPTSPNVYDKYQRIKNGFFKVDGNGNIIPFNAFLNSWSVKENTNSIVLVSQTSQTNKGTVANAFPSVPIQANVVMSLNTTQAGFSSYNVWGDLQKDPINKNFSSSIATNNNFETMGTGTILSQNGNFYFRNLDFGGGVNFISNVLINFKEIDL